jgi:Txe/YoeB family toxin of Txe-Axe toxin-antitoxin module
MKEKQIMFIDEKLKEAFENLKNSSENNLHKFIERAISDLKENPCYGIHIPKKLIPKEYLMKYELTNLWKYDLPKGWRLLYTIEVDEIKIVSIILEWMTHKEYDRLFGYKTT